MRGPQPAGVSLVRQVGWREWVALPDIGVRRLRAKFDTGARACALHAHRIKFVQTAEGEQIRFKLQSKSKWRQVPFIGYRRIKDTGGKVTERPAIVTTIEIGGTSFEAEVCLIDRSAMRHRLIIGRQAIAGRFLVDASQIFLRPLVNEASEPVQTISTIDYQS